MRCPTYDYLDECYRTWLSLGEETRAYEVRLARDVHRIECPTCQAQTTELNELAKKAKIIDFDLGE